MNQKLIDVAVAVIVRDQQVLLTYRHKDQDCGELWEFPGGKFEPGESSAQALRRECTEELAIDVEQSQPWLSIQHCYPKYSVRLHVFKVTAFSGEPEPQQGQPMRWVDVVAINQYAFPKANRVIVEGLLCG